MTPTLIATVVILALAVVFLRTERRELTQENARLRRVIRGLAPKVAHRWRTAQRLWNLRQEKQLVVDLVNAPSTLVCRLGLADEVEYAEQN